jgi:branched-subunit amino acid transport protein
VTANDWLYMALLVTATALTRSTLVLLGNSLSLPPRVDAALRYAPACALSAILLPQLLTTAQGQLIGWQGSAPFWAAVATTVTMWLGRSMLLAIVGGMAAYWLFRAVGVPV